MIFHFDVVRLDRDNWRKTDWTLPALKAADDSPAWRQRSAKALATLMLTQRATPFLYQGDELGMTNYPFRSVEAIHNAVRHAKPTVITVTLRWEPPNLILQVKDNGSGISRASLERSEGFGLSNMRTRASHMDGRLDIHRVAGHGTSIVLTVPIPSSNRLPDLQRRLYAS